MMSFSSQDLKKFKKCRPVLSMFIKVSRIFHVTFVIHHLGLRVASRGTLAPTIYLSINNLCCDFFYNSFKRKGNLHMHITTFHLGIKNFSCEFYGKSFGRSNHLRRHITSVHEDTKNCYCGFCVQSFRGGDRLLQNITLVHEDTKNI